MFLEEVIIENFRGYQKDHRFKIENLTALIGKNDVGKSTIFEALNIFFNDSTGRNIDESDFCKYSGDVGEIRIGCIFSDLPSKLVIDAEAETNLGNEYLLNKNDKLEIHKVYNFSDGKLSRQKIVAIASHPNAQWCKNLLIKKISELKDVARECGVYDQIKDLRTKSEIRQTIWGKSDDLEFKCRKEIELAKEDAGKIWDKLSEHLPQFALFRADRASTDEDGEVQDPLKMAIKQAIKDSKDKLEAIENEIKANAEAVAEKTIEQLKIFDPALAEKLIPNFKSDPKWDSIFKLSLTGDKDIPLNKRGSGVRRLVLFSFFKAEAERLLNENKRENIIYAVEEPETAQHPKYQRMVINALVDISESDGCQVMLTTHIPDIALLLPIESIRHITLKDDYNRIIEEPSKTGQDHVLREVTLSLGVLSKIQARVIVSLEGYSDIDFFKSISKLFHAEDDSIIDLENNTKVAFCCLGGGNLDYWINENYLKNINLPEVYIFDRDKLDENGNHKKQDLINKINNRGDNSFAGYTKKLEMENYLNINAINQSFGFRDGEKIMFTLTDDCKVAKEVENALKQQQNKSNDKMRDGFIKKKLAKALTKITLEDLKNNNSYDEIRGWLVRITKLATEDNNS